MPPFFPATDSCLFITYQSSRGKVFSNSWKLILNGGDFIPNWNSNPTPSFICLALSVSREFTEFDLEECQTVPHLCLLLYPETSIKYVLVDQIFWTESLLRLQPSLRHQSLSMNFKICDFAHVNSCYFFFKKLLPKEILFSVWLILWNGSCQRQSKQILMKRSEYLKFLRIFRQAST